MKRSLRLVSPVLAVAFGGKPEKPRRRKAILLAQGPQEPEPSEFIRIIDELTEQWAARRHRAAKQPVQRHFEVICKRDQ